MGRKAERKGMCWIQGIWWVCMGLSGWGQSREPGLLESGFDHRIWNNPAVLANGKCFSAGVFSLDQFLMKELGYRGVGFCFPVAQGCLGVVYNEDGYRLYHRQSAGLSYSASYGRMLKAGVRLNYQNIGIGEGYGSLNGLGADAGFLLKAGKALTLGSHLFFCHSGQPYLEESFPPALSLSLKWEASPGVQVTGETVKAVSSPALGRIWLSCDKAGQFTLKGGFQLVSWAFFTGFMWNNGHLRVETGSAFQPLLGFSPYMTLLYHGLSYEKR
ncbi:MAG: hypothetical protein NTU44_19260 [Bacteroidetes bacterium]|nr:hypothetical protein [Bacteroidota bacterium]